MENIKKTSEKPTLIAIRDPIGENSQGQRKAPFG
jgi:hypothetical protein